MNPHTGEPHSEKYLASRDAISKIPAMKPAVKTALFNALSGSDVVIATGATGSGKSLILPYLSYQYTENNGRVVCSQPRTVNASTIAAGVSAVVTDTPLGALVGYRYKYNDKSNADTRILYTTDGTLLSLCFKHPDFTPYDVVIIDEAHERNINIDLVLFFIREHLRKPTRDVKFIIMSATAQMSQFTDYFSEFKIASVDIEGRTFPVTQHYVDKPLNGKYIPAVLDRIRDTVEGVLTGDILVFLPSKREVDQLCLNVNNKLKTSKRIVAVPLYSGMDSDQELIATSPDRYRSLPGNPEVKVVVSTNIAETGVTIDKLGIIIDSGYEYVSSFDPALRESTLKLQLIPKASVRQRMGRAGRTAPGTCYHMYTKAEFDTLPDYKRADITSGNIDSVLLKMMHFRDADTETTVDILKRLIEPPSPERVKATVLYLTERGLLADSRVTTTGLCVYRLNMDVPVALFLIGCRRENVDRDMACVLATILQTDRSYQAWFRLPSRAHPDYRAMRKKYDSLQSNYVDDTSELLAVYALFTDFRDDKLKRWRNWLNIKHLVETIRGVKNTRQQYDAMDSKCPESLPKHTVDTASAVVNALLYGFGDQIAVLRRQSASSYTFDVRGNDITIEPEEGNGLSRVSDRVVYTELSNVLGNRKIAGLINIGGDV